MKKGVFLGIAIILVMIGLNLYYYFDTYRWQVNHQSKLMDREMELCVGHISDFFEKTSINILMAASPQELNCLLGTHCNATKQSCSIRKLALLYGPNLKSLTISNPEGHYFKSFRKSNVSLISEYGEGEPENFFRPAVLFSNDNKTIEYLQPLVSPQPAQAPENSNRGCANCEFLTFCYRDWETDRKSTRLNSSHSGESRMPSSA